MIDEEFIKLAKGLLECYNAAYEIYEPQVRMIIQNNIKDVNYIEYTLDKVLDIYTEKGFNLFMELLLYYRTVNFEYAKEYLEILKNARTEEYDDFIKKLEKRKKY